MNEPIEGVHYITDDSGETIAVQIDLRQRRDLWEDFEDLLIVEERARRGEVEAVENE